MYGDIKRMFWSGSSSWPLLDESLTHSYSWRPPPVGQKNAQSPIDPGLQVPSLELYPLYCSICTHLQRGYTVGGRVPGSLNWTVGMRESKFPIMHLTVAIVTDREREIYLWKQMAIRKQTNNRSNKTNMNNWRNKMMSERDWPTLMPVLCTSRQWFSYYFTDSTHDHQSKFKELLNKCYNTVIFK